MRTKEEGCACLCVLSPGSGYSLNFHFPGVVVVVGWQPLCGRCCTLRSNKLIQQGLVSLKKKPGVDSEPFLSLSFISSKIYSSANSILFPHILLGLREKYHF